jgi:hypothetical protein
MFYDVLMYHTVKDIFMKKKIGIFLFLPVLAFSGLNMREVNNVLLNIHASKELKYYTFKLNSVMDEKIKFTSIENADILLFPEKTFSKKIVIVGSYQELNKNTNSIGAIYLKKNRTQIIFIKERLKNKGLSLPKKFNKYIVSSSLLNSK